MDSEKPCIMKIRHHLLLKNTQLLGSAFHTKAKPLHCCTALDSPALSIQEDRFVTLQPPHCHSLALSLPPELHSPQVPVHGHVCAHAHTDTLLECPLLTYCNLIYVSRSPRNPTISRRLAQGSVLRLYDSISCGFLPSMTLNYKMWFDIF